MTDTVSLSLRRKEKEMLPSEAFEQKVAEMYWLMEGQLFTAWSYIKIMTPAKPNCIICISSHLCEVWFEEHIRDFSGHKTFLEKYEAEGRVFWLLKDSQITVFNSISEVLLEIEEWKRRLR